MNLLGFGQAIVLLCIVALCSSSDDKSINITTKIYSNIFVRKREEHRLVKNHLRATENYEKQFSLLKLAYEKILQILHESRKVLGDKYAGKQFPTNQSNLEALFLLLENTCLFGDLVLHMPDISYRVLEKMPKWKELITWSWGVTMTHENVIDERTIEMLNLFNQEINADLRSDDFVNPYREESYQNAPEKPKAKKVRKKIKKGPQLSGGQRHYEEL